MRSVRGAAAILLWASVCLDVHGDDRAVQKAVNRFVAAWNQKQPLPQLSRLEGAKSLGLQDAYVVQRHWVKQTLSNAGLGGVKGGVVTPAGQKSLGITVPVGALLRASGRFEADNPRIKLSDWPGLKIETEIGFVVGKVIAKPLQSVAEFKSHVRAIVPIIELPAGQWDQQGKPTVSDLAAVNLTSAAYIVGKEVEPTTLDTSRVEIELQCDGAMLHRASGRDCWKGPWPTGLWLARFAHQQDVVLQPGQVMLCGALGTIHLGKPGRYTADYGDLGRITFELE